jgi:RNA polymerase sigma-70 factor, ECF subfamily
MKVNIESKMKLPASFSDYTITGNKHDKGIIPESIKYLIDQCLKNDRKSQRQLFNIYKHKIHDQVCKSLGPKFDTDDIIQQVFIELFKSLSYFKGDSSLDTWVYRIGFKVCTTQLRKKYRKRQPQIIYDSQQAEGQSDDKGLSPIANIEQNEMTAAIYDSLDKLDAEKRMTVVMYEIDGKSLEEIAKIAHIPVGTVKSRLFHGRKILKKQLKKYLEK